MAEEHLDSLFKMPCRLKKGFENLNQYLLIFFIVHFLNSIEKIIFFF